MMMTEIDTALLIERLGGIRECATAWGVEVKPLRQAVYRGALPVKLWPQVLDRCREHGVECTAEDLMWLWIRK